MKTPIISLICIWVFAACTPVKESVKSDKTFLGGIHKGTATEKELVAEKGAPKEKIASITKPGSQSYQYQSGENYQVQDGKVVAKFRAPKPEETSLNYWRNVFKDVQTNFTHTTNSTEHETIYELSAPSIGMAVLYNEQTNQVFRVIEHANQ